VARLKARLFHLQLVVTRHEEYSIHLYGRVSAFGHYYKLEHIVWHNHKVFPLFSFSSSHTHAEGSTWQCHSSYICQWWISVDMTDKRTWG
jgi:hypothetical protein